VRPLTFLMRMALRNASAEWRRPPVETLPGTLLALERRGLVEVRELPILEYRKKTAGDSRGR
jgi:hypothetical protein